MRRLRLPLERLLLADLLQMQEGGGCDVEPVDPLEPDPAAGPHCANNDETSASNSPGDRAALSSMRANVSSGCRSTFLGEHAEDEPIGDGSGPASTSGNEADEMQATTHRRAFAVDLLQIQQRAIIFAISDCRPVTIRSARLTLGRSGRQNYRA
jgi:hypothetical protein